MRFAVISIHTSPLAQPGQGDAGGLNVYALQSALTLARRGHTVDIFTADPGVPRNFGGHVSSPPPTTPPQTVQLNAETILAGQPVSSDSARPVHSGTRAQGSTLGEVFVHTLSSAATSKEDLPAHIDELAVALAAHPRFGGCEIVWAHYWISAAIALAARGASQQLVVSFHTLGAVKNRDTSSETEPPERLAAEAQIATAADVLVANTEAEHDDLLGLVGAPPERVCVAYPGVNHQIFHRAPSTALTHPASHPEEHTLLYVGRMQHVKGTDVVIDALARLHTSHPELPVRLIMLGAGSGGFATAEFAAQACALGVSERIDILPPVPPEQLVDYYRAADVVVVPSRSESFGFVAAEAAATGTVIVGSRVGGLPAITADGEAGILVEPGNPAELAEVLARVVNDDELRARLSAAAAEHAQQFTWDACVGTVLEHVLGTPNRTERVHD